MPSRVSLVGGVGVVNCTEIRVGCARVCGRSAKVSGGAVLASLVIGWVVNSTEMEFGHGGR